MTNNFKIGKYWHHASPLAKFHQFGTRYMYVKTQWQLDAKRNYCSYY